MLHGKASYHNVRLHTTPANKNEVILAINILKQNSQADRKFILCNRGRERVKQRDNCEDSEWRDQIPEIIVYRKKNMSKAA